MQIRSIFAILSLSLFGLVGACPEVLADPPSLSITPLKPDETGKPGPGIRKIAGFVLRSGDLRFGGLSGLAVSDDGMTLHAVSDRGAMISMRLIYRDGGPVGIDALDITPLTGEDGRPLAGRRADAESLRLLDGEAYVSFEQDHRILRYGLASSGKPDGPVRRLVLPASVREQEANKGLEAFTRLADGRLLLFSEGRDGNGPGNKGWLCCGPGDEDHEFSISWPGPYVPTDLATLGSGDILVLLRHFTPIDGVSARLLKLPGRLFVDPPRHIDAARDGVELLRLAPPDAVDNMEGLAVLESPGCGTCLFIISDDNFSPLQRTLLFIYTLE